MRSATGELFSRDYFHRSELVFCTSSLVRIFDVSLARPDRTVVLATVNLFSVVSSDNDQFRL